MGGIQKQFEGRFDQVKGKIKETWGDITDDELAQTEGKWDQLVGKIKAKTGESQEEIERKLESM